MASGDTKTESYLRVAAEGTRADLPSDTCCNTKTQNLILGVANRIMDVEDEVEELKNNPDVADIVGTYQDLQNYGTSTLTDKDVIRVLQDETHDGDSTYYRYSTSTGDFTYIGESKQYTDFVGTDGTSAGEPGLVPAPATTDAGKFLKADGTWDTAGGGGPTVVQTTGTSTTNVMSQNATSSMVFADAGTNERVQIGSNASSTGTLGVAIGGGSNAAGAYGVSVGYNTGVTLNGVAIGHDAKGGGVLAHEGAIGIGRNAESLGKGSIALGAYSSSSTKGEMNIGTSSTSYGYNSSNYRLISGVYDGQGAHDVVTVAQVNATIDAINTALSTNIPHIGA